MPSVLNLQAIKDRKREAPDWILKEFLKRGNTALMLGQPKKSAKSWMILAMCYDLSEGKAVWGITRPAFNGTVMQKVPLFEPTRAMRCVYFTQEDTEDDIQDRLNAHFSTGRQTNDRLWVVPKNLQMSFDQPAGQLMIQEELDAVVKASGPIDLVAFDPMRRMHHGDENDSTTIVKIWDFLDRVHKRYNCATFISHHIQKPPSDRSGWDPTDPFVGRGSGDIYGGGDAFLNIVPGAGTETSREIGMFFESKRGKGLTPAKLRVDFKTGRVEHLGTGWDMVKSEKKGNNDM